MHTQEMKTSIDAAQGRIPADTLFENARIVDVYGQRIVPGSVVVKDGVIAGVFFNSEGSIPTIDAAKTLDCAGRYLSPGPRSTPAWQRRAAPPRPSPTATRSAT